ncbi:hypothetical protein Vafri_19715 [Volvox africanus]|uniref:RRM domain-containing protein n=1 Tax=Volvox africanus TaxID=51714 RepID=A0A8J4BQ41_9CHLO|nr:hypothetical protein Vafri_19715 [Volvox africanus]
MVVRLFLGGLPHDISAADLRSRFSPFGKVEAIEIIPPKDQTTTAVAQTSFQTLSGEKCRGFAYVELDPKDEASVHKCLSVYNNSKWRGNVLRVELAKPIYLARLHVEWQEQARLEEKQPQQLLQTGQQPFDPGNWFLPKSAETAAPTRPPSAKPSQATRPLPPLEVSAASLAAATAAAESAAAKRAKAATRSSRRTGPVPPPAPADLSQPLNLPNPYNRHRPIEVNLAQPAKLPRRSFPVVTPLPLARLEWQRDDDFGELLRAFSDVEDDEGDSDNDSMTGGGSITANGPYRRPLNIPSSKDGGAAARPRKRSRTDLPFAAARSGTLSAAAGAPSALYHLNHVWAQPMRPYNPSTAAAAAADDGAGPVVAQAVGGMTSQYGVVANMPPSKELDLLQPHVEQGRGQTAATDGKGSTKLLHLQDRNAPVAAAGAAAVMNDDADEGAVSAVPGSRQLPQALPVPVPVTKREVRGEMLSMFKVLKAIDSETRKRSAEEAAAARAVEARATTAVGSWKGPKGAKQQQQKKMMMASRGQTNGSAAEKAEVADGLEEGGDGVVNFLDGDEAAGNRFQAQQLMLDKFDDSDELGRSEDDEDASADSDGDSEDFHHIKVGSVGPLGHTVLAARPMGGGNGGSGTRDANLTAGGRTAKASSMANTASPPPSISAPPTAEPRVPRVAPPSAPPTAEPKVPRVAPPSAPPTAEPKVPRVAPPSAPPMAEPKVPRVAPPSAPPMAEPKVPRVAPPSAPPMAEPKVPRVAPPSAPPGTHSRPSKQPRELSDAAEAGVVRHRAAAALRSAPSRRLSAPDVPLVPLGPHRGGAPAEDLLARFGGGNDSDCEEVFHDVYSTDSEMEDVSGRVQGAATTTAAMVPAAPATAAAVIASKRLPADLPSTGWVSFLDDVEEDGSRAAGSGRGRAGTTLDKRKVIGSDVSGGQRRQSSDGRGRTGGGRGTGTPVHTATDSVRKGVLRPPSAPTPSEEPHVGEGQNNGGSRDAEVLEAPVRERQCPASAPPLLVRQKQRAPASGGPLLATSFVRPAGSSDEELRAAWLANFGGLIEGARDNVRTAQRAIQGRVGAGGPRRGPGSRRR